MDEYRSPTHEYIRPSLRRQLINPEIAVAVRRRCTVQGRRSRSNWKIFLKFFLRGPRPRPQSRHVASIIELIQATYPHPSGAPPPTHRTVSLGSAYVLANMLSPCYNFVMIPIDQREVDAEVGDCFKCCVASILELPYEAVPHFVKADRWYGVPWFHAFWDFLRPMGLDSHCFDGGNWGPDDPEFAIVSGKSPRFNCYHAVVYQRGRGLVYDPHPSRAGIVGKPTSYMGFFTNDEFERWYAGIMRPAL